MIRKKYNTRTQTAFLIDIYTADPLISNQDAFKLLKAAFPNAKTKQRTLTSSWKYILRKRGVKIPYQRYRQSTYKLSNKINKQKGKTK